MKDFSKIGYKDHPRNGEEWVYMHHNGKWYGVLGERWYRENFSGNVYNKMLNNPMIPSEEHMLRLNVLMLAEEGTSIIALQVLSWNGEANDYSIYEVYPPLSEAELQELNEV